MIRQIPWCDFNPARAISLAVVLAVHVMAFVFVTLPSAPFHAQARRADSGFRSAVRVRLINRPVSDMPSASVAPSIALPQRKKSRQRSMQVTRPDPEPGEPSSMPTLMLHLPTGVWNKHGSRPRVARGVGAPRTRQRLRLPGGGHVAGAPRLHLLDPRQQDIAGVVRALSHMAGAVDPACVKVDAWQTMSMQELARQGVSPNRLQQTAEQHGCVPPKRKHGLPPGASGLPR